MTPTIRIFCVAICCAVLAACASTTGVKLPSPPPPGEPPGIVGLSPARLKRVFGAPAFVRKDGQDEMWRYDAARCKAFFFLYPQDEGLQVRHVETLPHGTRIPADASCLDALRLRASPPPVS